MESRSDETGAVSPRRDQTGDAGRPKERVPIQRKPGKRRRRFPILRNIGLLIATLALVGIVVLRWTADASDIALVNIVTLILGFIALLCLALWPLTRWHLPRFVKWAPLVALFGSMGIAAALLRIEGVNGAMVPRFRWAWQLPRDRMLVRIRSDGDDSREDLVDLSVTSPHDFPEFLGPTRDGWATSVQLDPDWEHHPPKLLWRQPIGAGWSAFSVVNSFAVTMEQRGDEESVTCYELLTGKLRWARSHEARHETVPGGVGPRSTPTIHDGRVYSLGATGILQCLEGATGEVVWRVDLFQRFGVAPGQDEKEVAWGRAASPLVVDDLVIVPAGGPKDKCVSLAAFQRETGELAWTVGDTQISYASPALCSILGQLQVVIVNESTVTGHDPKTGEILWSYPWPGDSSSNASVSQPRVIDGERMLLCKGYFEPAQLLAFQQDSSGAIRVEQRWLSRGVLKTKFTNVIVAKGFAYGLSDGALECVDLATGKRRWKQGRNGMYQHGQVLAVGDLLLVQAESGSVALVELTPERFHEIASYPALSEPTWNNLCLFGKYLLVRNASEAACLELAIRDGSE